MYEGRSQQKTIPMFEADITFDFTYYPLAFVTLITFLLMFKYVSFPVSTYLFPCFSELVEAKQIYWITSCHSTLHAFITSTMCIYALLYEKGLDDDPIWHDSVVVKCSCAIVVGYMSSDAVIMILNWKKVKDIGVIMHHLASIYAYYYVMSYGTFIWFANFRLMAEFSTPWVNNRWFLATMNVDKSSTGYMMNGIILTAVFFCCRILCMPLCWYKIYDVYGTVAFLRTGYVQYVLILSCAVLDILNVIWFIKLVRGINKTLTVNADSNRNTKEVKSE